MNAIKVERVERGNASDVEPPLNPDWDDLTKLQWHAAVASLDTGLLIEVHEFPSNYGITVNHPTRGTLTSTTATGFYDAWTLLSGIDIGARAARKMLTLDGRS